MNTTTSISLSTYLNNVQLTIIRSLLTPIYVIGTINNIANVLVFSQNTLRSHICSWYFIGASIGHLFYLNLGCLTRVLWGWTKYDLSFYSLPYCRARIYFVLDGLTVSRYLFCLISIDRWMTTSKHVRIRQLSSRKVALRLLIGGISFLLLINTIMSVGYTIDKDLGCGPSKEPVFALFNTIYNIILSLGPLSILFLFSLLTLFNIRRPGQQQIVPVTMTTINTEVGRTKGRYRKTDVQFVKLALVQVAGYMLFNTLHAYNTIYAVITVNHIKSADRRAIDAFLGGLGLNLHYTYTGVNTIHICSNLSELSAFLDHIFLVYNGIDYISKSICVILASVSSTFCTYSFCSDDINCH